MGAPRLMEQKQQIQKAYQQVQEQYVPEPCEDLFSEIKVDALDKLYIQARTVVDSWIIWVLILIGVLTVLPFFLKKFGIKLRSPLTKRDGK